MTVLTQEDINQCRAIATAWLDQVLEIMDAVAAEAGVNKGAILGPKRGQPTDRARQIIMFVADRQGVPRAAIAAALKRDISSVTYGIQAEAKRRKAAS